MSLLVTKTFREGAKRAMAILEARGLKVTEYELGNGSISEFASATSDVISSNPGLDVVAIVNGGQKPWAIAMVDACPPEALIAYGESERSEVSVYTKGKPGLVTMTAYNFTPLDLKEILACAGASMKDGGKKAKRLWKFDDSTALTADSRRPLQVPVPDYGKFVREMSAASEIHLRRARAKGSQYPSAKDACKLGCCLKLKRTLERLMNETDRRRQKPTNNLSVADDDVERVLASARKVLETGLLDTPVPSEVDVEGALGPLGGYLEGLVADAVVSFVKENPCSALASIWMNVEVSLGDGAATSAEWDIALVFRNAAVIHLECKTVQTDKKDLDARVHNLVATTSSIAKLVLVTPCFTNSYKETWFVDLNSFDRDARETYKLRTLRFTAPDQPRTYSDRSVTPAREATIEPFKEQLALLFAKYK